MTNQARVWDAFYFHQSPSEFSVVFWFGRTIMVITSADLDCLYANLSIVEPGRNVFPLHEYLYVYLSIYKYLGKSWWVCFHVRELAHTRILMLSWCKDWDSYSKFACLFMTYRLIKHLTNSFAKVEVTSLCCWSLKCLLQKSVKISPAFVSLALWLYN